MAPVASGGTAPIVGYRTPLMVTNAVAALDPRARRISPRRLEAAAVDAENGSTIGPKAAPVAPIGSAEVVKAGAISAPAAVGGAGTAHARHARSRIGQCAGRGARLPYMAPLG